MEHYGILHRINVLIKLLARLDNIITLHLTHVDNVLIIVIAVSVLVNVTSVHIIINFNHQQMDNVLNHVLKTVLFGMLHKINVLTNHNVIVISFMIHHQILVLTVDHSVLHAIHLNV
jgi:hypothetical protein